MEPTIALFDVDGTLVTTNGAGRRALERSFVELFGRKQVFENVPFAGMTDYGILRAGFEVLGRPELSESPQSVVDHYLGVLEDELNTTTGISIHAGVESLLDALEPETNVAVGLGTGNLKAGASLKLKHVGIAHRFEFGGFGSDHENRAELLRAGAHRGAAVLNRHLEECRRIVIGDTPKDITAGHAIGALTVAVATGPFAVADLEQHQPTMTVEDLTDERVRDLFFGVR